MSAWIKMRSDLAEDPAVIMMAERLELDVLDVVGRLHRIWAWADAQTTDGRAPGVSVAWLDELLRTPSFGQAMIEARWLRETPQGLAFPKFDRHIGHSAKARALNTDRKQGSRLRRAGSAKDARPDKIREEKKRVEEREGTARTPSPQRNFEARTGGVGGASASEKRAAREDACDAYQPSAQDVPSWAQDRTHSSARLLRAVDLVEQSAVSPRRKRAVIEAVKTIWRSKDPVPTVSAIVKRARGPKVPKPGGYVAKAIIEEADQIKARAAGHRGPPGALTGSEK